MKEKESNINISIDIKNGGVLNVANDNGSIMYTDFNKDRNSIEEPTKYISDEEKNRILNLFSRNELMEVEKRLTELELYATTKSDKFFISLYLGKFYLHMSEKQEDKGEREQSLNNAINLLIQANKTCLNEKQDDIYRMYFIYMSICLRLGDLLGEAEYYKKGIEIYEEDKLEKKIGNKNRGDKYVLLLDYALLLDKYSQFCNSDDAKKFLNREYACYQIIGTVEELEDNGLDFESAYRFFVNFGRCLEQLIEYSDDRYDELVKDIIDLYNNALDSNLVTLRKYPDRYGLVNNNLGNIYGRHGSKKRDVKYFEMAEECYKKAMRACEVTKDKKNYYSYKSNYARLLSDKYNKFYLEKDLELAEKVLIPTIDKRFELGDYDGGYISRYQLAQLNLYCAKHTKDEERAIKAIELFKNTLEYYTEEFKLDIFYKVKGGLFESELVLYKNQKEKIHLIECIEEQIKFVTTHNRRMSSYVSSVYIQTIISTFFGLVEALTTYKEADRIYHKIKLLLNDMGLDIDNYISIKESGT